MSRNSTPPPDNDGDGDDNDDDASLVGRWFSVDGNQGVVRYVGPVSGTRGTWLGVEWADAGRGKHGGTRNGHRYFRCRWAADGGGGGSFIRRVARIDWGQTVLAAARARYAGADGAVVPRAIDGRRRGRIEAVGFDRVAGQQADLRTLATLGLDSLRVYGVGHNRLEREETRRLLGAGTRTLLLANNYLTRWSAVTDILDALRGVETLDVSANHFATPLGAPPPPPECGRGSCATRLDTLRLDSSPGLTWHDASAAAAQLRARAVSFGWSGVSALASAALPAPRIDGLEELRLECNRITDIAALSAQLPRLRVLSLRGNRTLVDILPNSDAAEPPPVLFPALESLNLADTGISSWAAVDRLALLPRLATLHLAQTPLFETAAASSSSSPDAARTADVPRAQTVGRLGRITKLDGSAVSADERADLERYYLALCARQLTESHEQSPPSPNDNPTAAATVDLLAQAFPRIPELVAKHGAPPRTADQPRSGLKHRLASVSFEIARGADVRSAAVMRSVARRLIRSMLVRQLHPVAARLAGSRAGFAVYLCADPSADADAWVLLDPATSRDLAFYGLEDRGSVIRILLPPA
ncbi:hypothetical protein H4217_007866 [Coemansia sp. RSA 1939]|nr:hypothetical protein H4217_007866 [Coemansia sp. RSA 1939]